MSISASASEIGKNFGAWLERVRAGEAVRVTQDGQETAYIVSASEFRALKQAWRDAIAASELNDAEIEAISRAEIPAEARYSLNDLG